MPLVPIALATRSTIATAEANQQQLAAASSEIEDLKTDLIKLQTHIIAENFNAGESKYKLPGIYRNCVLQAEPTISSSKNSISAEL